MVSTHRSIVSASAMKLGAQALSVVAVGILIRAVGMAGYGHITTAIAGVTVAAVLLELGLTTTAVRGLVGRPGLDDPLAMTIWRLRWLGDVALGGVGSLGALLLWLFLGWQAGALAGLLTAGLVVQLRSVVAISMGYSTRHGARVAVVELASKALWVLAVVAGWSLGLGWQGMLALALLVGALPGLLRRWLSARRWQGPTLALGPVLMSSLPLTMLPLVQVAFNRADVLALSVVSSASVVGRYSTCYRAADAVLGILVLVTSILSPGMADPGATAHRHADVRRRLLTLAGWLAAMAMASAPLWLRLFAGSQLGDMHAALVCVAGLGVGLVFYAGLLMDTTALVMRHRQRSAISLLAGASVLEAVLVGVVAHWGIGSVAVAVALVELCAMCVAYRRCRGEGLVQRGWTGVIEGGLGGLGGVLCALVIVVVCGAGIDASALALGVVGAASLVDRGVRREIRELCGLSRALTRRD
jgi:O-antigen/teichoic acid export membrane protein